MNSEELDRYPWSMEIMQMINKMTPDIKGKAFDPDWFMLRQKLEAFEQEYESVVWSKRQMFLGSPCGKWGHLMMHCHKNKDEVVCDLCARERERKA